MSFEILGQDDSTTVYAPLNTTIDADRDYYDLAGLDACACGGQMPPKMIPPGAQLNGFYQDEQLTPGMLGEIKGGINPLVLLLGGMLGAWMIWGLITPHREYR